MITEYEINTPREGLVDVTDMAARAVRSSGVAEGLCLVYCPHTTAGITINENADPDVARDFLIGLGKAFPDRAEFHLKASAVGSSATVIVSGGLLVLGTWQGIYLCEFDGPRRRRLFVKVLG